MTQYRGLCIGGPLDGQRLVAHHPHMKVHTTPSPAPSTPTAYQHHRVKKEGLWLLEGVTPEEAVQHMAKKIGILVMAYYYEQTVARRKDDERHG